MYEVTAIYSLQLVLSTSVSVFRQLKVKVHFPKPVSIHLIVNALLKHTQQCMYVEYLQPV